MNQKNIITLVVLILMPLAGFGKSKLLKQFKQAYPQSTLSTCLLCHAEESDYTRNSYGNDFTNSGNNFQALEALDSDGDGYSNLVEIQSGSLPGDKNSYPGHMEYSGRNLTDDEINLIEYFIEGLN